MLGKTRLGVVERVGNRVAYLWPVKAVQEEARRKKQIQSSQERFITCLKHRRGDVVAYLFVSHAVISAKRERSSSE